MTKERWQASLTQVVAGEIRRYRKLRGLSGQALADRCAQLGLAIPAAVLSNLELGRRESVAVAELVIIAQALEVSPTLLMVPVTTAEQMEILPGREAGTMDVLEWFAGETGFVPARDGGLKTEPTWWDVEGPAGYVHLYRVHDSLVSVMKLEKDLQSFRGHLPPELEKQLRTFRGGRPPEGNLDYPEELRLVRQAMRKDGLRVPDLPPSLAHIDAQDEDQQQAG